ncbi:hypothetical protein LOD99_15457 [Oopsacas minuta]|uniref:Uncharacterized protein n=1 Tax=Oopsacas minuta TaxID=111878 RepID=A0AAV7KAB8_9METZ|nr:hypothetical protein LOD99_15457 [Oopsacas minuta]
MSILKSISSIAKNFVPTKLVAKKTPFSNKFEKEIQSLKSEASENQTNSSPLPERLPMPPGVYNDIMQKRRAKFVRGFWQKPELSAVRLAGIKKKYILAGYNWPSKPLRNVARYYENSRSTFYHPDKIKRMEKIDACMKKMPELLKQYNLRIKLEKEQEELKNFKTEQEIYLDALNAGSRNPPSWVEEDKRQAKLKKAQSKQLIITTKKKKK